MIQSNPAAIGAAGRSSPLPSTVSLTTALPSSNMDGSLPYDEESDNDRSDSLSQTYGRQSLTSLHSDDDVSSITNSHNLNRYVHNYLLIEHDNDDFPFVVSVYLQIFL